MGIPNQLFFINVGQKLRKTLFLAIFMFNFIHIQAFVNENEYGNINKPSCVKSRNLRKSVYPSQACLLIRVKAYSELMFQLLIVKS